jgi:hypothetical protein
MDLTCCPEGYIAAIFSPSSRSERFVYNLVVDGLDAKGVLYVSASRLAVAEELEVEASRSLFTQMRLEHSTTLSAYLKIRLMRHMFDHLSLERIDDLAALSTGDIHDKRGSLDWKSGVSYRSFTRWEKLPWSMTIQL